MQLHRVQHLEEPHTQFNDLEDLNHFLIKILHFQFALGLLSP